MFTIIDMNMGNIQSVANALKRVGADVQIATTANHIKESKAIILPGVGAFGDGIASLKEHGLLESIKQSVLVEKKPILGICLGLQLLGDSSQEYGYHEGLGLIKGNVVRLNPTQKHYRVPNIGWCDLEIRRRGVLFDSIDNGESFYFAHSYYFECGDPNYIAATIDYSEKPIVVAIEHENIFGVQFHPEKSHDSGLAILRNFTDYLKSAI